MSGAGGNSGLRTQAAWIGLGLLCALGSGASPAWADDSDSFNDFGGIGLLQTPTARMTDDGGFGVGISHVTPYNQAHFQLQFLPWLETVLRYTDVTTVPYGPQSFSGTQTYKDRSADFKLRLLTEGEYWPQLALGLQDAGGTGLFSSEYLVASRRYYDVDLSFGVAWGRLGSRGGIRNPFAMLSSHFDKDRASSSTAGGVGLSRLFVGRSIGPFGGFRWQTPIESLSFRAEYDGNDYKHEALGIRSPDRSPVNFGVDYHPTSSLDLSVGYERGDTISFNLELLTNFQQFMGVPKFADPKPPPVHPRSDAAQRALAPVGASEQEACESAAVTDAVRAGLARQGFTLYAISCSAEKRSMSVWLIQNVFRNEAQVVGRAARVLTETAPDWVEQFVIVETAAGTETLRTSVLRKDFEAEARYMGSPEEIATHREFDVPQAASPHDRVHGPLIKYPHYALDAAPAVRQQIGGPSGFYFGQIWARVSGRVDVTPHLSLSSSLGFNIYSNLNQINQTSDSQLPHVRSDIVQYLKQGKNNLVRLEANYIWSPAPQWYARFSTGIFEEMYGGVAGEVLYRPAGRPYAVGFDGNWVKQRGYDQRFDFRDYSVATGHLNFYEELPFYQMLAKLSVGRYLAGDYGATLDLSRSYRNGVTTGIFATRTNVSAARFGEGSFDKGVYISIPLDLLLSKSSTRGAGFVFRPVTRDGGQMVRDGTELYGTVGGDAQKAVEDGWPDVMR